VEAGAVYALSGCGGDVAEYQKSRLLMLVCADGWMQSVLSQNDHLLGSSMAFLS
jgi:hypothetical protein